MKKLLFRLLRIGLFIIFIGYFIIAIFVNTGRLELWLKPLDRFDLTRIECVKGGSVCLGTYPEERAIEEVHPKTIVTLLNPKLPFSKELVQAEKTRFVPQGIKVISIPISWYNAKAQEYDNLLALLANPEIRRPVYIHAYLFDHRLEALKHRLVVKDKASE